ncbi:MAG: hypothetical protein ACTHMB_08345 [Candidatus Binatia bacterium]
MKIGEIRAARKIFPPTDTGPLLKELMGRYVCSLRLLGARCNSIEQMELVNALCRLAEYAQPKVI